MVRILADSSCDLSAAECKARNIEIVPLTVTLEDGTVFQDGSVNLDHFYTHLVNCKTLPTTSQPSPASFAQLYQDAKEAGDDVVVVTLSSGVSGTYQSACIGAQLAEYEEHVFPVDSQNLSLAHGSLVLYATKLRDEGRSAPEIAAELDRVKTHLHLFAMVNDLNNLRKGGRLNAAAAFTGGLLGIKPLLKVQDGKIVLIEKARGLPGAYAVIFKHMSDYGGISERLGCYAAYADRPQQLTPILDFYKKNHYPVTMTGRIGAVIGTHVGPGSLGVAYFDPGADLEG